MARSRETKIELTAYDDLFQTDESREEAKLSKIPFGFNSNGKLVFWLGDLNYLDTQSQAILKGFNVDSDHLIVDSEFYQAQMNCTFSKPIIEKQILMNKDSLISNVKKKYNIDLAHLDEECSEHAKNIKRPLVFTEQSVSGVINAFDKVLVEGFNVGQLRVLYETLYIESERDDQYRNWQSIRLIKEILLKSRALPRRMDALLLEIRLMLKS